MALVVDATVPFGFTPTTREWHAMCALVKRAPLTLASDNSPCLVWTGAPRFRYRRKLWTPRRLFYALTCHGGARTLDDNPHRYVVDSACATPHCLTHLHAHVRAPPTRTTKKRAAPSDESSDIEAKARRIIDDLHRELAALDAAGVSHTPHVEARVPQALVDELLAHARAVHQ